MAVTYTKLGGGNLTSTEQKGTEIRTGAGSSVGSGAPSYVRMTNYGTAVDNRTQNPYTYTPKTTTKDPEPTYYGSSGGSSGGGDDGASARLQALRDMIEQARANALNSMSKSYETGLANLRNNMGLLEGDYQKLIDQNEVERYKTMRSLRENQANRGQLDSGLGRQAMLNTDTRFANANAGILSQREADRTAIKNLMEQMRSERQQKEAEINNQYNNSLMQLEM